MTNVQEALNAAFEALLPFADCLQYIEIDEDDEEWAKFRLLIKHYRQAAVAYEKCKSALSEIENCEPVAEVKLDEYQLKYLHWYGHHWTHLLSFGTKLYTSPISKEWVGLSDQQIQNLIINSDNYNKFQFIKSVEHTVKQLNVPEKG